MASVGTPSANEPAKDLILVHIVQLKPMIKAHFSGRMVSSGISDVAFASVCHAAPVMLIYNYALKITSIYMKYMCIYIGSILLRYLVHRMGYNRYLNFKWKE